MKDRFLNIFFHFIYQNFTQLYSINHFKFFTGFHVFISSNSRLSNSLCNFFIDASCLFNTSSLQKINHNGK